MPVSNPISFNRNRMKSTVSPPFDRVRGARNGLVTGNRRANRRRKPQEASKRFAAWQAAEKGQPRAAPSLAKARVRPRFGKWLNVSGHHSETPAQARGARRAIRLRQVPAEGSAGNCRIGRSSRPGTNLQKERRRACNAPSADYITYLDSPGRAGILPISCHNRPSEAPSRHREMQMEGL
jgi:hypothetical protein